MADTNTTIKKTSDIVAVAIKYHAGVKEDRTLGETFYKAGLGLGLIRDALRLFPAQQPTETAEVSLSEKTVNSQPITEVTDTLPSTDTAQDQPSADTLLRDCHKDATLLKNLFRKISQAPVEKRLQSYKDFLRENGGNHNLVERLVLNLMLNLCRLAKYYGIEEGRLKGLRGAMKALEGMESSDPNIQATKGVHSYSNQGSGNQFNATTGGTQTNVTGSGLSLLGANFHGAVTFSGTKI